jgi:capsular exopolysaccharide synthesis family protein
MSRIHEALKRAAQDRSERSSGSNAPELIDILGEEHVGLTPAVPPASDKKGVAHEPERVPQNDFDRLVAQCRRVQWNVEPRFSVFANEAHNRAGAEKFRTLRSRLYQIAAAQPLRRLLLTSSIPEEGKTFVATNLAQSIIRQSDRRVLLIDADLRASRMHIALGAPNEPGLADYLRGELEETAVIQVGNHGNLCFLPGGRQVSNPSELLQSERMKALLDRLTPMFDWIILDSPPAIAVHDASVLADMCDGVLFVVRAGTTDFELARKAAAEFQDKNLLGVILNRVEKSDTYGDYYYGYGKDSAEK